MKNKLRDTTRSEKEVSLETTNFNMEVSLGVVVLLLLDKKQKRLFPLPRDAPFKVWLWFS